MKEQDYVLNTLISLKHLKSFFSTFSQEASGKEIQKISDSAYNEIMQTQRNVYTLMVDKGWMKVQYQTQSAIEKEYKKYEKKNCGE